MTIRRGPLRLPGLLSAVACAAIVVSGCESQPGGQHPGGARTGTASPRTSKPASPRQLAVADAARIMASFPRPPGAVRTGPIASLTQPGARPITPDLASVTRWWRVPGRPQEVLAWVGAHLPPGFAPAGTGTGLARLTPQYGGCGIVSAASGAGTCPRSVSTRGPARRCSSRCWPSRA
jgi:hypothetical protein